MHKGLKASLSIGTLILVIFAAGISRVEAQQRVTTRELFLSLKHKESGLTKAVSMRGVRLRTQKTLIKEGDTIRSLLELGGIKYDGSSLSLVYDLNPALESAGTIEKGSEIVLPVAGGGAFEKNRTKGFLVAVVVDKSLKKTLVANYVRLEALHRELSKAEPSRNENSGQPAIESAIKEALASLQVIKTVIVENNQPFSHDSLSQLVDETDLMIGILVRMVGSGKPVDAGDRATIIKVYDDLTVKVESFSDSKGTQAPDRQKDVRVIVKTLRNGQPASSVRVYYIGEALFGNAKYQPKTFTTIDNPSEKNINEGDYMVWAGKAEDSTRLSQPVLVNIRKNQLVNGARGLGLYIDIAIK